MRCITYTGYRSLYKAAAAVAIDPEVPWFGVWRLGRIGFNMSINFLARKCGASTFIGKLPWSNWSVQLAGLCEISSLGRCSVQTTLDMISLNFAKQFSAKQLAFLPVKADEAAAKNCQDLRLLNSLSRLQVVFCWIHFVKFTYFP